MAEAQIPVLPFSTNFHNLLAPLFPHPQTKDSSTYFKRLVCEINEILYVKYIEPCLAYIIWSPICHYHHHGDGMDEM